MKGRFAECRTGLPLDGAGTAEATPLQMAAPHILVLRIWAMRRRIAIKTELPSGDGQSVVAPMAEIRRNAARCRLHHERYDERRHKTRDRG